MAASDLRERVRALMDRLVGELGELVAIPSVSGGGAPAEPIRAAHDRVAELFAGAGVEVQTLELPGTNPIVTGSIPAPPGAPTVLLYSHYDVVPAGDEALWYTPPFEPVLDAGALHGRGSADTKANVLVHLGALRAWGGRPPVGVRLLIEGQEESGSGGLAEHIARHPERFAADLLVIGDAGSVVPGLPTLTVALRGAADIVVCARALPQALHSGQYGGAAPDALLALLHALATLHDERGDVAVPGLRREQWTGGGDDESLFRELAGIGAELPLLGSGDLGSRLWSGPAITVIGLDATPVAGALNAIAPEARAKLNVRVHPEQSAREAQRAVIGHLRALRPFGIELDVREGMTGDGFAARTDGPAYAAARKAWDAAWGQDVVEVGVGGSVPVVAALAAALPEAEVLLVGATDGHAGIHGPNERVLLSEFENAIVAEADLLGRYAALRG